VRFGVVVPSYGRFGEPATVLRLIGVAEELGYEGAWFADHVVIPDYATDWLPPPQLEPLACCFVGMGATTRLRFGVDVLVAAYRHPLVLAKTAATADQLSGGRLTLGIGVGYLEGEFAALGVPYAKRGAVTDEWLRVMRRVWSTEGPVSFAGDRVAFDRVHLGVRPAQYPGVPLWVGGNVAPALRRAALLGDGWHPLWPTPGGYAAGRKRIVELRAEAGIDRPFTYSYSCPLSRVLEREVTHWDTPPLPGAPSRPEYGYVQPLPRAPDDRPRFTGTPEQLVADVEAFAAAGVEHLTLRFWTSAVDLTADQLVEQMARFATDVAPRCA
jgi:probable F420-dependent oxidoreductase